MIISQFWLPESARDAGATATSEEFYVLVTNLEAVPLRFRFVYFATQTHWPTHDSTAWLRQRVLLLGGGGDTPVTQPKFTEWTRIGQRFRAACELDIRAGETDFAALKYRPPTEAEAPIQSTILQTPRALRGHVELTLPPKPPGSRLSAQPKPQIDHAARVLVTPLRRLIKRTGSNLVLHELAPLPLASGKAEHMIVPDGTIEPIASSGAAVVAKRRAVSRRRG